ncbi:MAG TPA: hypothetical protein DCX03_09630 [Bacteroidales bacterium]|nr:hypothetical protein [Bacteroidales bacterium]
MAIIKLNQMLIQIVNEDSGDIKASVTNIEEISPTEVIRMNNNLDKLVQLFTPTIEYFGMPITNAVALWLVKGFGQQAEIISFDEPSDYSEIQ